MLFHSKLQKKFTLLIVILITFIMLILTMITIWREKQLIENELYKKGQVLLNTLAETAKDPLIKSDYPALKDFIKEVIKDKEIEYVFIFDDTVKRCVAYIDKTGANTYEGVHYDDFKDNLSQKILKIQSTYIVKNKSNGLNIVEFAKPIVLENIQYGIVRIGLSLNKVNKEIRNTILIELDIFIVALIIGTLLAWYFTNKILIPLRYLVKEVNEVAGGNLKKVIKIKSNDEFEELANNFNKMISNINILYEISNEMIYRSDTDELIKLILQKALYALNSKHGSLMLLDEEEKYLKVKYVIGHNVDPEDFICIPVGEGVAGRVAKYKKGLIINSGYEDDRFKRLNPNFDKNIKSLLCVPLYADNKVLGVINIVNKSNGELFNETDLKFMEALASQAAIVLTKAKLYEDSITDGLTKLYIHRYFQNKLDEEIKRAKRYGSPLSLLMIDIDHFKKFNDTYGHQTGDIVLIHTAKLIKESIRDIDIAARYGGEEIAVIMPETNKEGAYSVAERLRNKVSNYEYPGLDGQKLHVTISIGLATYPQDGDDKYSLIKKADKALYTAKAYGRNKVVTSILTLS